MALVPWHILFTITNLVGSSYGYSRDVGNFIKGFGSLPEGRFLAVVALSLIWLIRLERNAWILKDRWGSTDNIRDPIFFFSSLWASITKPFVEFYCIF